MAANRNKNYLYIQMKVVIVVNTSWNIYNFRLGLIQGLQQQGIEVVAIAPEDGYSEHIRGQLMFQPVDMQQKGINPLKDLRLMVNLYRTYKSLEPDCILHYTIKPNIYGTIAARLAGIPSISNVSGLGTVFLHRNIVSRIAINLYRLAFRFPSKIFFQNNDDRILFTQLKLVNSKKTDVLPGSGINLNMYAPKDLPSKGPFTFLFAARLLYDKGVIEYVKAAEAIRRKYPSTIFQIAGALDNDSKLGVSQMELERWIQEGIVEYKGFVHDMRSLMTQCHCVVLPSYREGVPRSLIEAAAVARPIIATDVPGCKEITRDGYNGFLCRVKNHADLASKMEKILLLNEKDITRLGANGRALVENKFNEQIVVEKYLEAIRTAAKK